MYVIISGAIFALLVLAHVARLFFEGITALFEPTFAASTILAIGMTVCSWGLLFRRKKQ
jgi:hypothetical protein